MASAGKRRAQDAAHPPGPDHANPQPRGTLLSTGLRDTVLASTVLADTVLADTVLTGTGLADAGHSVLPRRVRIHLVPVLTGYRTALISIAAGRRVPEGSRGLGIRGPPGEIPL